MFNKISDSNIKQSCSPKGNDVTGGSIKPYNHFIVLISIRFYNMTQLDWLVIKYNYL